MKAPVLLVAAAAAATAIAATLLLTGCGGEVPAGPVPSGITRRTLSSEVVGYLECSEGDFSVFRTRPGTSSVVQPELVAELSAGSVDAQGIQVLDGMYVWAAGRLSDGDPPVLRVDAIDVVQAP